MKYKLPVFCGMFLLSIVNMAWADRGVFDLERWDNVMQNIRTKAAAQNAHSIWNCDACRDCTYKGCNN